MPSAEGKRVGRVLAGCSKPEAGDKPGLHTWQEILGIPVSLHRSPRMSVQASPESDGMTSVTEKVRTEKCPCGIGVTSGSGIRVYAPVRNHCS